MASAYERGRLSFLDRLVNAASIFTMSKIYRVYHLPRIEKLWRESHLADKLGDMPPLDKLIQNTSLMLMNQHFSDQFPRPYPPFVIEVGGMHVDFSLNGTLPHEMQKFIGDAEFIYISFGTFVRISAMPINLIQIFFDVIRTSKFKFLWKWEGRPPVNAPSNIFFKPWFPQQDVLTHPKIRAFVTQCGQISTQQGVCHGVPLIACPVDADQDFNAMRMADSGNAIKLELARLTTKKLENAFKQIVDDPSYARNAKRLVTACKDRPMSAVKTAVWWVEYVIRTDDTSLLRPLKEPQSLWKLWNLDLWAFVFSVMWLSTKLMLFVIKTIVCRLSFCPGKNGGNKTKAKLL